MKLRFRQAFQNCPVSLSDLIVGICICLPAKIFSSTYNLCYVIIFAFEMCVCCIYLGLSSMTLCHCTYYFPDAYLTSGLQLRNELSSGNVDESSMLLDSLLFRFAL
jgi:hypothetical protein